MTNYIRDNLNRLVALIAVIASLFAAFKIFYNIDHDITDLKIAQKETTLKLDQLGPSLADHFEKARCKDALTLLNMSLIYPHFIPMDKRDQAIEKMFEAGHGAQLKDLDLTCKSCDRKILAQFISQKAVDHHCPRFGISYAKNKSTKSQIAILNKMNEELKNPI